VPETVPESQKELESLRLPHRCMGKQEYKYGDNDDDDNGVKNRENLTSMRTNLKKRKKSS
jgi:hypothetical protein